MGPVQRQRFLRSGKHNVVVQASRPQAFLITFLCYGAKLPGSAGFVWHRDVPGSRYPEENAGLEKCAAGLMLEPAYLLTTEAGEIVIGALRETASYRGWTLLAAHARTNHVHVGYRIQ